MSPSSPSCYLPSYIILTHSLSIHSQVYYRKPLVVENLVLNAIAGLSAQLVTYPLDIVRRRMQVQPYVCEIAVIFGPHPNPKCIQVAIYVSSSSEKLTIHGMLLKLLREEGLKGLTKGFSLNVIKGPITLSLSLTTYDYLREKRKTILRDQ